MQRLALCAVVATLFVGCAPKADLEKATAEVTRLTGEVASLKKRNDDLTASIVGLEKRQAELQAQLGLASMQVATTAQQLSSAEQQLAKKPVIPVSVNFRPAGFGPGYVAMFQTTIKQALPMLVTFKSKALGTTQQFRVNLRAAGVTELGHAEGAALDLQDELLLENQNYSPALIKVTTQR